MSMVPQSQYFYLISFIYLTRNLKKKDEQSILRDRARQIHRAEYTK